MSYMLLLIRMGTGEYRQCYVQLLPNSGLLQLVHCFQNGGLRRAEVALSSSYRVACKHRQAIAESVNGIPISQQNISRYVASVIESL